MSVPALRRPVSLIVVLTIFVASVAFAAERPGRTSPDPAFESIPPHRVKPFSAKMFAALFRTSREQAKHQALAEAETFHLRHADLPAALGEAVRNAQQARQVTPSVLRAIRLLGRRTDAPAVAELTQLLDSTDGRIALTAAQVLAEHGHQSTQPAVMALADRREFRESYGFRQGVMTAVSLFETPASVAFLIERLPQADGQLEYEIAFQLTALTGQNFGNHAPQWQEWWQKNRATFRVQPLASLRREQVAAVGQPMPWNRELPRFYEIPIYARRFVFVIDRSRSMSSSVDGETRLDRAQKELAESIRGLDENTWFSIVAYDDELTVWRTTLVPADEKNKSDALRFIWSQVTGEKTACFDAVERAFAFDKNLEAIFLLSDGKPTAGQVVDPKEIVEIVTSANEFRRVAINTFGIDARDEWHQFLQDLADQNFGEFKLVR